MRREQRVDEGQAVQPGLFRHQIAWQEKRITGQDGFGQDVFAWVTIADCRCQIKELQGRELQDAMQRWAEAKYEIRQHFVVAMDPRLRGSWFIDGVVRYLDILGVTDPPGTRLYQVIYAKEWNP